MRRVSRAFRRSSNSRISGILREISAEAEIAKKIEARKHGVTIAPEDIPDDRDPFTMAKLANEAMRRAVA